MNYILIKLSEPGWEKCFERESEMQKELYRYICTQCRCEESITEISDIEEMLGTACGCEFIVEEE